MPTVLMGIILFWIGIGRPRIKDLNADQAPSSLKRIIDIVAVAAIYYVTARLGQLLAIPPGNITPVWLPSGITLAAVLIRGYHLWPGIFLGAFIGNVWPYFRSDSFTTIAASLFSGTANGIGDVLSVLISAYLLKRTIKTASPFDKVTNVARFILYGVALGPAISALFGVTSLVIARFLPWTDYTISLLTWWTGDAVGVLILTPVIIIWVAQRNNRLHINLEAIAFIFALLIFSLLTFDIFPITYSLQLPLFSLLPILIWGVFRLDTRFAFTGVFTIAAIFTIATAIGHGPFSDLGLNEALIDLQLFLAVISVPLFLTQGSVAERKQAELELRQWNHIFEHAEWGVVAGNPAGTRLQMMNPAFARMHGYSVEELTGRPILDVFAPDSRGDLPENIRMAHEKGHHLFEANHIRKDGSIFPTVVDVTAVKDETGQILYRVINLQDITERKQAEEALRKAHEELETRVEERTAELAEVNLSLRAEITERQRVEEERSALIATLESQNAELERFNYTISHDLKSPLITIQGFLGFMEASLAAGAIESAKNDLVFISNAVLKMNQLLNELLNLSRVGHIDGETTDVSLSELAHEVIEDLSNQLSRGNVRAAITADLPVVRGSRARLYEVILNLVDNAIKFMGSQPDPFIEIGMRREQEQTIFFVRDNGIGINPAYHEKVFGLFERLVVDSAGTGIGLAIVKRIIEMNGGRIWIESGGNNQGSAFCFTLPKAMIN